MAYRSVLLAVLFASPSAFAATATLDIGTAESVDGLNSPNNVTFDVSSLLADFENLTSVTVVGTVTPIGASFSSQARIAFDGVSLGVLPGTQADSAPRSVSATFDYSVSPRAVPTIVQLFESFNQGRDADAVWTELSITFNGDGPVVGDCGGLTGDLCDAVDFAVAAANDAYGTTVVAQSSDNARLRPSVIYEQLGVIVDTAEDNGCLDGNSGGAGGAFVTGGALSGATDFDGEVNGTLSNGTFTASTSVFSFGPGLLRSGLLVSTYFDDTEFIAGHWVRTTGRRGVWVGLTGQCATDAFTTLDPWFPGAPIGSSPL